MRAFLIWTAAVGLAANSSAQEWPYYGGDSGGSKYSKLDQIDRRNVARLKPAWTFHIGDSSDGTEDPTRSAFEATPLVIDGVMYVTTPFARMIALEAETGKQLWTFDPQLRRDRNYNLLINRGAAYWTDGKRKRLYWGTLDGRLLAIDAVSGKLVPGFGREGSIDLRQGVAEQHPRAGYGLTSPPAIYRNLVLTGALTSDGEPQGPAGDIRAWDVNTGKLVWQFHTVPRPGEFGHATWEGNSWKDRGGVNAWSVLSVDQQRGILYVPLTSPSYDYYGGDRPGDNLFSDSLLALDAATGKRLWHFQTIHHDLWDWDLPAQPNLITVRRNGRDVAAVAQIAKTGFVFVFDRVTGKPLFDIEERPVPQSQTPGERTSPTQPFPVKPPAFARQTFSFDELTDVTPESRAECRKLIEGAVTGPMFRPVSLQPTVIFPGTNGGANWGGASFDPATATLYVNSMDVGAIVRAVKRPEGSVVPYRNQSLASRFWDSGMNPCQKPPWGHLTAIDLNTGEFRWRVVLGVVDELLAKGIAPTGTSNLGGSIVTAGGVLFIGATNDRRFRAFDKDTGDLLWETQLPASAHATPMTFLGKKTGKQFVVIAAGGGNKYNKTFGDVLLAYALP